MPYFFKDIYTEKELFKLANNGNISILKDKNVSSVINGLGNTPLHILADEGKIEVLSHPDCSSVKTRQGSTPLHTLAWYGYLGVLQHSDVCLVINDWGSTPLHLLSETDKLTIVHLKEMFPWFSFQENQKVNRELIDEILNSPNSVRFIYEQTPLYRKTTLGSSQQGQS